MGLLRTLLIIALVYYGIKFLAKLFAPFLKKYAVNKMQEKFNQQQQDGFNQDEKREPEGKTSVVNKPKSDKGINTDNSGEYIDYEEIE
jgi:hypothetical protein